MNQYQEIIENIEKGNLNPFYQLAQSVRAHDGWGYKKEFIEQVKENIPKESFVTGLKEVIKNITWPFPGITFTDPSMFNTIFKRVYDESIATHLSDEDKFGLLTRNMYETYLKNDVLADASDDLINQYLNHLINKFAFTTYLDTKKQLGLELTIKLTPEKREEFVKFNRDPYSSHEGHPSSGFDALIEMGVEFTPEEIEGLQDKFSYVFSNLVFYMTPTAEFPQKLLGLLIGHRKNA